MGEWNSLALKFDELERLELHFRSLIAGQPFEPRGNQDILNSSIFSVVAKPRTFLPKQYPAEASHSGPFPTAGCTTCSANSPSAHFSHPTILPRII
jgi:hypothetical protein